MTQATAPRRKEQARSRETRTRLLEATLACLAEGGYAALTTEEVARRAGVSRGAQLHHYRTRHALVRAAIEHLDRVRLAEFQTHLRERLERSGAGRDPIRTALDAFWDVGLGPLAHAELALLTGARSDPALRELLTPYVERRRAFALDMLRPLLGEAVDHPDFAALLTTFFDTLRGIATIRVFGDRSALEARQRDLLERLVRDVLHDIAPEAEL